MNKQLDKWNKIITNLIRIIILVFMIGNLVRGQRDNLGIMLITFVLTFYDFLVKRIGKIELDTRLKISIILFIFSAQFLGSTQDWYERFFWWDSMLHTISGIIFMYIGITIINEIDRRKSNNTHFIVKILFGFCFALTIGVFWEMFEFLVDRFLGGNMQRTLGEMGQNAIMDTMIDLTSATVGAVLASVWEIVHEKSAKNPEKFS